jgi:hypothetical protein
MLGAIIGSADPGWRTPGVYRRRVPAPGVPETASAPLHSRVMTIFRRARLAVALLPACLLVMTGCATTTAGTGSGSGAVAPSSPSAAPSTSPSEPASTTPSEPPSSSPSTPSNRGCSGNFCDDFSSKSSGWDTGNRHFFYSKYSPYMGGTLQMGERHDSVLTVPAPYVITKAAHDYSVQIDTQMYVADGSARNSIYGVSCWNHSTKSGGSAAFLFYVTRSGVQIALWDNIDGTEHILKKKSWRKVLLPTPKPNTIRVLCLQRHDRGGAVAELGISVNGNVLTDIYAKSAKNYAWAPGNRVALLVGLTGSNVFYDNFEITGECKGSDC